jgi:hypothetical protein
MRTVSLVILYRANLTLCFADQKEQAAFSASVQARKNATEASQTFSLKDAPLQTHQVRFGAARERASNHWSAPATACSQRLP